jgi:hypothetical protein
MCLDCSILDLCIRLDLEIAPESGSDWCVEWQVGGVEPQVEARINRVCPARSGRGGERPLDLQGSALCRLAGRALPLGVVPVPGAAGCCDIPLEALGLIRTGQIRRSPEQGAPLKNG